MIMTIDPGTNGTGWAVWDSEWNLKEHGVITGSGKNWDGKMREIGKRLKYKCKEHKVKIAHIEEPAKFQSSFGNMVADKGDLVKLAIFVGYLHGYLGVEMNNVRIIDWKGQLPKDVVIKRIKKLIPDCQAKSHDWDAIGIGLFLAGRF